MKPQLYSPIGLDLKPVEVSLKDTVKLGFSGAYSPCMGSLTRRMIRGLSGPVSTGFRSSPVGLYSWGVYTVGGLYSWGVYTVGGSTLLSRDHKAALTLDPVEGEVGADICHLGIRYHNQEN